MPKSVDLGSESEASDPDGVPGYAVAAAVARGLGGGQDRRRERVSVYDLATAEKRAIGDRLRQAREAAGLKQAEAAVRLGYAQAVQVSNMEAGNRLPPLAVLVRMAEMYGTTADYLLGLVPDVDRDPAASMQRWLAAAVAGDVRQLVDQLRVSSLDYARRLVPDVARVSRLAALVLELQTAIGRMRSLSPEFDDLPGGASVVGRAEVAAAAAQQLLADLVAGRVQFPDSTR